MIAARRMRTSILQMRQREGWRVARALADPSGSATSPGGRVRRGPDHVVDEKGGEQVRMDPRPGKVRVPCPQGIEVEKAFQSLERQIRLPAEAMERPKPLGRIILRAK